MIIHHHLGLGDHFVCNGLVNYFSKLEKIDLICKKYNEPTVKTLYQDNNSVTIVPIPAQNELLESYNYSVSTNQKILRIGFDKCDINNWDRSFYSQVGLDFVERYRLFKLPKKLPEQAPAPQEPFIFIHSESSEGSYNLNINSSINNRFYVKKTDTDNLLGYLRLITMAEEIHCINSSLFHLIDSIPSITNKLYYHNIRHHPCTFEISNKWSIVNYDN
jgi:hypothetical protein